MLNPLTTDDECTHHATLATRYQLAQDRFCASKKGEIGGGGWVHPEMPCTWQLPWLAVEKPWSTLAWPFLSFLTQTSVDKTPLPL